MCGPAGGRWRRWRPPIWRRARSASRPCRHGRARRRAEAVDRRGALPYCPAPRAAGSRTMTGDAAQAPEFSRPIAVEQIGPQETVRSISANATERRRLAERFGLLGLDRLEATVRLRRGRAGLILAEGHFEADATQACVVTLEPVPDRLALDFAVKFGNPTVH